LSAEVVGTEGETGTEETAGIAGVVVVVVAAGGRGFSVTFSANFSAAFFSAAAFSAAAT